MRSRSCVSVYLIVLDSHQFVSPFLFVFEYGARNIIIWSRLWLIILSFVVCSIGVFVYCCVSMLCFGFFLGDSDIIIARFFADGVDIIVPSLFWDDLLTGKTSTIFSPINGGTVIIVDLLSLFASKLLFWTINTVDGLYLFKNCGFVVPSTKVITFSALSLVVLCAVVVIEFNNIGLFCVPCICLSFPFRCE
ncbi:MAG: hypothetical protein BWY22_02609 [Bacteroidetes bacterium ADurb.Bin217]|nr:MAG: hypothetical protein BWY22_02609 [Bacteroidetes bacterium ADurb.Bin217]